MGFLADVRTRKKLSQAQVAAKSGIQQADLSRYETGTLPLSPAIALKLAPVLSLPATALVYQQAEERLTAATKSGATVEVGTIAALIAATRDVIADESLTPDVRAEASERAIMLLEGVVGKSIATADTHDVRTDDPDRDGMGRYRPAMKSQRARPGGHWSDDLPSEAEADAVRANQANAAAGEQERRSHEHPSGEFTQADEAPVPGLFHRDAFGRARLRGDDR